MERKVSMEDITYDMDGNIHFHVKLEDEGTSKRVEELEEEVSELLELNREKNILLEELGCPTISHARAKSKSLKERLAGLEKQLKEYETKDYLAYEEGQAWADEAMKAREVMNKLNKYLKKKCDACQVRKEHCQLCSFYDVKEIIKPSKEEEQWELL